MSHPSPEFTAFADALAGQYELEREIGRGGMGVVYLARDVRLDRRVAIKTLPTHLASDPVFRERFLREARTAAALSHQNIVPIHRADELGGFVFFVMGYVDGDSMAERIRTHGRLDPREVARALRDVAEALGYAHAHGVIHRDVKAENILIDRSSGRAMVTDFGIARLAEAAPLTATGQLLGTVYYLSPEQVLGESVDARSDIYALGVVGYFALSGRFPFDAEFASAVLVSHVTKTPPPLQWVSPQTPNALADIVDRCLLKNPDARFQNCSEVASALSDIEDLVRAEMSEQTTADTPPHGQSLLSDTEAQSIFARAAELQAQTGIVPRPAPIAGARDAAMDAARQSGHRVADIRDAAVEAGIPAPYVDHALGEHGLVAAIPASARPMAITDRSARESPVSGGRMQLEFEVIVDGEIPIDDYDLLVDLIRQGTGQRGDLATVGRSFSWTTKAGGRDIQVSVLPRNGKTTIRVSESLASIAGGIFGGIIGGVGGGSSVAWIGLAVSMRSPLFGILSWAGTTFLAYAGAREWFGRLSARRATGLRELTERLAAQARESIAAAGRKLDPGNARRLRG